MNVPDPWMLQHMQLQAILRDHPIPADQMQYLGEREYTTEYNAHPEYHGKQGLKKAMIETIDWFTNPNNIKTKVERNPASWPKAAAIVSMICFSLFTVDTYFTILIVVRKELIAPKKRKS